MQYKKLQDGRKVSCIGFGLYKGKISQAYDNQLIKTINFGIKKGINIIDTAQKYRNGRSEKIIKRINKIKKNRKNFVFISKVGLIPQYIKKNNILKKLKVKKENCLLKNDFCIDPKYINWSLDNSLKLMGTNYLDFYLLHNPEYALQLKNGYNKIFDAFKLLEEKRIKGKINYYGIATWSGLRRLEGNHFRLNLYKIFQRIKKKFGPNHGFRCLEAPLSIGMPDVLNYKVIKNIDLLKFLKKNKIDFFTSASLYEGNLEKLSNLNEIYNSFRLSKDRKNELVPVDISFPKSENSIRRLFILLENYRRNNLNLKKLSAKFSKLRNIYGLAINSSKIFNEIKCHLIGMEDMDLVVKNIKEYNHNLKNSEKKFIRNIWKKIKADL